MTASSVVKPGPERKYRWEGRRSCVWCLWLMGFWWGPECCWTVWIWIYLSDMIAAVLSLGGEEKTNNRKHCGVREQREGGVWWGREKKWWNVGVISVSERSGYYPACQSHLPSCLASFLPTPPPPSRRSSSALIAVTGLSLNLSLFWLCLLTLFLSLRVLLAGARKPKLAIPRSEKEKEEVSIPQLLPLRTWQPFFSSPRDQTDKIVVRTPLKEDLDPR